MCTTQHDIVWPEGSLGPAPKSVDADGDQLVDAAEHELALCAMPEYIHDSAEWARLSDEPAILYSVFPTGFSEGHVKLEIRYAELYAQDGGFWPCGGACPASGCANAHLGDSSRTTVPLLVRSRTKAEVLDVYKSASFDGTHPVIYHSAGKHHYFEQPHLCNKCDNSCCHPDALDSCINTDRADGQGDAIIPAVAVYNVGQEEPYPFSKWLFPLATPNGFINDLSCLTPGCTLGYPGSYVYDPCIQDLCPPDCPDDDDPAWRKFRCVGGEENVASLHYLLFAGANVDHAPLFYVDGAGTCSYSFVSAPWWEDLDGDAVPGACDNCPSAPNKDQADSDEDGVGDACDACPGFDDHKNADGDACPDGCDHCPNEHGIGVGCGDEDDDGVCDSGDNCKLTFNPGQRNRNFLSEQAHPETGELGDACEPVPVPDFEPSYPVLDSPKTISCPPDCSTLAKKEGLCPWQCPTGDLTGMKIQLVCGSWVQDTLELWPRRSQPLTGLGQPASVWPVVTPARFCQKQGDGNDDDGIACDDLLFDIQDERRSDSTCFDPATCSDPDDPEKCDPETKEDHFHRVTFAKLSQGNGPDPDHVPTTRNYVLGPEAFPSGAKWQWRYEDDYARWIQHGMFTVPPPSAEALVGNFWIWAETEVGNTDPSKGTGYHGAELANAYWLGYSGDGYTPEEPGCSVCWVLGPDLKQFEGLGSPAPHGSAKALVVRPLPPASAAAAEGGLRRSDAEVGEAELLVHAGPGFYGLLGGSPDCGAEIVNESLSAPLLGKLKDSSLVWAVASEPFASQGVGASFPLAVALSAGGNEVAATVTATANGLVTESEAELCFSLPLAAPALEAELGAPGSGPGLFDGVSDVVVDGDGSVLVADRNGFEVEKLSAEGEPIFAVGGQGTGDGEFGEAATVRGPQGLALDRARRRLYAADGANGRINVFDADDGTVLGALGEPGEGPGQLGELLGLAVAPATGELFVADTANGRIQVFGPDGELARVWGGEGAELASMSEPRDVAVDRFGNVYVLDSLRHEVLRFSAEGEPLGSFGGPGSEPGQLAGPRGIAVDDAGNVYVADTHNVRVQVLTRAGTPVSWFDGLDDGPDRLEALVGIDIGPDGRVYAADDATGQVRVWAPALALCPGCASGMCGTEGDASCCALACLSDGDCPAGLCSPENGVCVRPALEGSPHAEGFFPVLSRVRGGVFVVGGDDPDTGLPTGEIWFGSLAGGREWQRVPSAIAPASVLATTYDFATDALYVLDQTALGDRRLWTLSLRSYEAQLLASFAGHTAWDEHFLVTDRDGALLVASTRTGSVASQGKGGPDGLDDEDDEDDASFDQEATVCHQPKGKAQLAHTLRVALAALPAHLGHGDKLGRCPGEAHGEHVRYAITRLDVSGAEPVIEGIEVGKRRLLLPPLVDGKGYTLVLAKQPGKAKPAKKKSKPQQPIERVRRRRLHLVPAGLVDLGAQL